MNTINHENGDQMEESKRCVLIITNDIFFTKHEIFCFYHCKKNISKKIYAKMVEIYPVAQVDFFIFHVPLPDKIKKKHITYLTQYIDNLTKKIGADFVFNYWKGDACAILKKYLNNKELDISCVIYYYQLEIIKRYAKLQRVPLKKGKVIIICDDPQQAEPVIKKIIREAYQIQICAKEPEKFTNMIHCFLTEYGILLKAADTLGVRYSDDTLVLSCSTDFEFVSRFIHDAPILNISPYKYGMENIYEDVFFTGNASICTISKKCGGFHGKVLLFLFFSFYKNRIEEEFCDFVHKYGIKTMKIVKND